MRNVRRCLQEVTPSQGSRIEQGFLAGVKTILDNYSVQLYSLKLDTDDVVQCLTAVEEFVSDWTETARVLLWIIDAFKSKRHGGQLREVKNLLEFSLRLYFSAIGILSTTLRHY